MKELLKRLALRAMRPALNGVERRLDALDGRLASLNTRLDLLAENRQKYDSELEYWRAFVRGGAVRESGETFEALFGRWTRNRIVMLGEFLGLPPSGEPGGVDDWCAAHSAIELGCGPYPTLAAAAKGWAKAVAVDPLARAYVEERLIPVAAEGLVFLQSRGETIPLPSDSADLVICENCLDHVSDPAAVVREIRRLVRPGGYLWFFVDLSHHRDEMHPHAMDETLVRRLLCDFQEIRAVVSGHKAHPEAYGSIRGLFRRPPIGEHPEMATGSSTTDRHESPGEIHVNGRTGAGLAQAEA